MDSLAEDSLEDEDKLIDEEETLEVVDKEVLLLKIDSLDEEMELDELSDEIEDSLLEVVDSEEVWLRLEDDELSWL